MLRVMNTLTHRLEPFAPRESGHVRMYVCGPSVYDESHLGHARSYVAYDTMKRYFLAKGMRVTHVQNFTDVEENVTKRAQERGLAPLAHADRLIARFFEDMDALRILRADHYPRVSEHIPEILALVQELERKRIAYRVDCGPRPHSTPGGCDVYFSVERAPDYGALIGQSVDELTVERPDRAGDRRNPLDFALWKARDDWGVTWPSPYGEGRPGWHVECTAMSTKHLGAEFDIHGGGLDLVFPHHENERVVGEAVLGRTYCRYYLHNGFVTVGDRKMSKSLGNFVTVADLLARHEPEVLRAFLLCGHYRGPINYDEEAIALAEARVARWRAGVAALRKAALDEPPGALPPGVAQARAAFWAAMEDDFHFERALEAVDAAIEAAAHARGAEAAATLAWLDEPRRVLGLLWE